MEKEANYSKEELTLNVNFVTARKMITVLLEVKVYSVLT